MRTLTTAIHIWIDHGGWGMPACGLLGPHKCIPAGEVFRLETNDLCAMCFAAAIQPKREDVPFAAKRRTRFVHNSTAYITTVLRFVNLGETIGIMSATRPGTTYRLQRHLTAVRPGNDGPAVAKLAPGALVTVASVIRGSQFVQVSCDGAVYEVIRDDLLEAGQPAWDAE